MMSSKPLRVPNRLSRNLSILPQPPQYLEDGPQRCGVSSVSSSTNAQKKGDVMVEIDLGSNSRAREDS